MKNHQEMFEALLLGETLIAEDGGSLQLKDGRLYNSTGILDGLEIRPNLQPKLWSIKQKTININGFDVPEPCRVPLKDGTKYYLADPLRKSIIEPYTLKNDGIHLNWLKKGLVHLTFEAAQKHVDALLSFTEIKE